MRKIAAFLAALLLPATAWAQGAVLQQGGAFQGHASMFLGNGYIADAGGPMGNGLSPINPVNGLLPLGYASVNSGLGTCQFSAYAIAPSYYSLCWGFDANGNAQIVYGQVGNGPNQGLNFVINGTTYPFGAGIGNMVGPSPAPTAGNAVLWNGGLTAKDAGAPPGLTVATIAALKALSLTLLPAGTIVGVNAYATPGDMPPDTYKRAASACSLNSGAGDGGSQIPSNTSGNCWLLQPEQTLSPAQWGVVYGGSDPNTNNAAQLTAALAYAATLPPSTGVVDLGGNEIGFNGHVEIAAGIPTLQNGKLLCISSCGSAGAGSGVSTTFWNNSGPQTNSVWTPPQPWSGTAPVGMLDIAVTATAGVQDGPTIRNMEINCNYAAACASITNNASTRFFNNRLYSFTTYGLFTTTQIVFDSNRIWEGAPNLWTGIGLYVEKGAKPLGAFTDDSIVSHNLIWGVAQGAYINGNDFKFTSNHIFPDPVGPSSWKAMVFAPTAYNGTVNNNTFDNGEVVKQMPSGIAHLSQIVFVGNVFENGLGSALDGQFILQCMGSSPCGGNIQNQSNTDFWSPLPNNDNGNYLQVYAPAVLEDAAGNFNPDAFSQKAQSLWNSGNNCTTGCQNVPYINMAPQGAQFTFTGAVANASNQITGASIIPVQGTAISDTGGCLPVGAQLTDQSWNKNQLWYSASAAAGSPCISDTIHVGSLTLTGNVLSNFTIVGVNNVGLALNVHITDSAGCLPLNSRVSGYNDHTGVVLFNSPTGGSTCASASDTFTVTPYQYYLSPADTASLVLASSSAATTTFYLRNDNPAGWFAFVSPRNGAASVVMNPISSAQLNGGTASMTLLGGQQVAMIKLISISNDAYEIDEGVSAIPAAPVGLGSGWGTGPSISGQSTTAFSINVGTGGTATFGLIQLPQSATGWVCNGSDITSPTAGTLQQTNFATNSATVANYKANALSAWNSGDVLLISCKPF